MLPAGSGHTKQMFPGLEEIASSEDLAVISDEGEVYLNNHAWIMCLYALTDYREWACRLAHPLLLPFARQAFDTLSKNRFAISRWLGGSDPQAIADELRQVTLEPCLLPETTTISDYLR
jgi:predicted DCC family thiol-disulfide oxidoreductase YuxK